MININRRSEDDEDEDADKAADDLDETHASASTRAAGHQAEVRPRSGRRKRSIRRRSSPSSPIPNGIIPARRLPSLPLPRPRRSPPPSKASTGSPTTRPVRRIRRVRRQFEALRPRREILRAQPDGDRAGPRRPGARAAPTCRRRCRAPTGVYRAAAQARDLAGGAAGRRFAFDRCAGSTTAACSTWRSRRRWCWRMASRPAATSTRSSPSPRAGATWVRVEHGEGLRRADDADPSNGASGRCGRATIPASAPLCGTRRRCWRNVPTSAAAARPHRRQAERCRPLRRPLCRGGYPHGDPRSPPQRLKVFGVTVDAQARVYFPTCSGRAPMPSSPTPARLPTALPAIYRHITM